MTATLLVLDDDELVGAFVCRVAQDMGFSTRSTTTIQAFQAALAETAPTEIVLDLRLGRNDGIEVLRLLAASDCRARITLLSGFDDRVLASARGLAVELGLRIGEALAKPIRLDALRDALGPGLVEAAMVTPQELVAAIEQRRLFLEYQPIVNCSTGAVDSVEALVRWRRDDGIPLRPDLFVPVAEADPVLMHDFTLEVARQAADAARAMRASGFALPIAINISAQNLGRLDFPEQLAAVIAGEGAEPAQFKLEVTETGAMKDPLVTLDVLLRIRLKGFSLAVDDFGTGHTSIALLRRLPYTELKIDRSFVARMLEADDARAVVAAAVSLARSMGLSTVAEGVESAEILDALRQLGTTAAQGYYFSRPLGLDRLLPWLVEPAAAPRNVRAAEGTKSGPESA